MPWSKNIIKALAKQSICSKKQTELLLGCFSKACKETLEKCGHVEIEGLGLLHTNDQSDLATSHSKDELKNTLKSISNFEEKYVISFLETYGVFLASNLGSTPRFKFKLEGIGELYNLTTEAFGKLTYEGILPMFGIRDVRFRQIDGPGERVQFKRNFDLYDYYMSESGKIVSRPKKSD